VAVFDEAVAEMAGAGVDAEDAHGYAWVLYFSRTSSGKSALV
jgi:hypothetical protein